MLLEIRKIAELWAHDCYAIERDMSGDVVRVI